MKHILGILIMVFSLSVNALEINTNGLSEEQKATLALEAAKMKILTKGAIADEVSKWVDIGKNLGTGLNATAKELGLTANELAKTPLGVFVIILIAWNYMGESIVGILFGLFWLMTTIPTWIWMYRSRFVIEHIETYDRGAREDGLRKIKKFQTSNFQAEEVHIIYWFTLVGCVIIGIVSIFV